jgi:uncharacterized protein
MPDPVLEPERAFLGVGWAFPLRLDVDGEVALVAAEEDIRESILLILGTTPGERVMRPDFGSGLRDLVFEPISATTMELVRFRAEEALVAWEPRIDVESIRVTADEAGLGRLDVEIGYRIRATNTFYNLVYPFHLIEGDPR